MPRMPRFFVEGVPMHVVQRGNDRRALFLDDQDFVRFANLLEHAARKYGAAVHAYVFMTNHVHLLATPATPASVPRAMQWAYSRYVAHFNVRYGRNGALLESRYRAAVVDDDRYLFACMRYIELNPVRAGMSSGPADYRWSSFHSNAAGADDSLLTQHPAYRALGGDPHQRRASYLELFRDAVPHPAIDLIRDATRYGWAIGGSRFRSLVTTAGRRAERLPLGRPARPASATRTSRSRV